MGDLNHSDDLLKDSVALAEPSFAPKKCNPKELVIPIVCHSTKEIFDAVNPLGIKLDKEVASLTISILTKGHMNEKEALIFLVLLVATSRAKQWWT